MAKIRIRQRDDTIMSTYSIALEDISLVDYQKTLQDADLLPGRVMLKDDLQKNFKALRAQGIQNLKDLSDVLKTETKLTQLSNKTGISTEYLTILRREINGFLPKPVALTSFTGIDKSIIGRLAKEGIKSSKDLFERAITKENRRKLSMETGIGYDDILALAKLSDIARVNGVGPVFAQMLCEAGCDSVVKFAKADPESLFNRLQDINQNKRCTNAKYTAKDIAFCCKFAKMLPHSIEYEKEQS